MVGGGRLVVAAMMKQGNATIITNQQWRAKDHAKAADSEVTRAGGSVGVVGAGVVGYSGSGGQKWRLRQWKRTRELGHDCYS